MPRWACLLLAVALWWAAAGTVGAHTEVLRAEPQPGTEVSGPVEQVRLTFLDPVLPGTTISVAGDGGQPVVGLGAVEQAPDGLSASVAFDPLGAGGYVVEYRFTAEDGDQQLETYRFTVRPEAAAEGAGAEDDGLRVDAAGVGAAAVFTAALVATLVVALARRARTHSGTDTGTDTAVP